MTPTKTVAATAAALLLAGAASAAQAQAQPYGSQQPSTGEQVLGALFGALFGNQTVDDQWRRGGRPLFNGRAQFETQLDTAVRNRTIASDQAARLRTEYADLVSLETRYYSDRRFTTEERADLGERYRLLSERLQAGGNTGGGSNYGTIADGRAAFDARVDASLRDRNISRNEATRLKADYATLIRLETSYQSGGISARERSDLDTQLAALNARVGDDYDGGYGAGDYRTQLSRIETAISTGERSGQISRTEGERLRTEHSDLTRLEAAYAPNGYNSDESGYLTRRIGELDTRVRNTRR